MEGEGLGGRNADPSLRIDEIGLVNDRRRAGAIDNGEVGKWVYIGSTIFGRGIRAAVTYRF